MTTGNRAAGNDNEGKGPPGTLNFIQEIIEEHHRTGRFGGRVHTRFPPEPNGYLHLGHAKSICLNHGLAVKYAGKFNLRFDDTNPTKEEQEYVDSIREDVRWLGGDWEDRELYASDYFDQLCEWAEKLIKDGKAYVQAGGGWVNDSTPEGEFQETINKSMAMRKAVEMAESFH